jgi:hypothetical protein
VSIYPCELHQRRVPGALEHIRFTIICDGHHYSRRLRLCPDHLSEVVERYAQHWTSDTDLGSAPKDPLCPSCEQLVGSGPGACLGITYIYRARADPDIRAAQLHDVCAVGLVTGLNLEEEIRT